MLNEFKKPTENNSNTFIYLFILNPNAQTYSAACGFGSDRLDSAFVSELMDVHMR